MSSKKRSSKDMVGNEDGSPPMKRQRQSCAPTEGIISLNVGGTTFVTMRSTLLNISESYFARRFGGQYDEAPTVNGHFFIDRDPTHFRFVLQYLRDQRVDLPDGLDTLKQLLTESMFFGMDGLAHAIKLKMKQIVGENKKRNDSHQALLDGIASEVKRKVDRNKTMSVISSGFAVVMGMYNQQQGGRIEEELNEVKELFMMLSHNEN